MATPTIDQVLTSLDSICYRIHTEPASMRAHMNELSTVLGQYDTEHKVKYCWLEASIRQSQLNRFTECCTLCGEVSLLCLFKIQNQNAYNLCFTNDVDQCICRLSALCHTPIELVASGKAKLTPETLVQVLSEPHIQKNRWFPLKDIELERIVKVLTQAESLTPG